MHQEGPSGSSFPSLSLLPLTAGSPSAPAAHTAVSSPSRRPGGLPQPSSGAAASSRRGFRTPHRCPAGGSYLPGGVQSFPLSLLRPFFPLSDYAWRLHFSHCLAQRLPPPLCSPPPPTALGLFFRFPTCSILLIFSPFI